jgi:hypothetical protein
MTMTTTISRSLGQQFATVAAAMLIAGCGDQAPLAPDAQATILARSVGAPSAVNDDPIVTIKRVTARYHDLDAALADGFVFLHGCETRPEEGPAGALYVNFDRLLDGVIDPSLPDALLYEPGTNAPPKLLGVELAIPYPMWPGTQAPRFMRAEFQREDEFGVFGLHIWAWTKNPEGMFAEANPDIDCGEQ